jgi:hypothetical protein
MARHIGPAGGGVFAAQDGTDDGGEALLQLFMDAYAPLLRPPDEGETTPAAQDDVAAAAAVAERLFSEETALRFLPESAAQVLGPIDEWRWCLQYVRCCWIFGFLVCRGCRDYRTLNYYLYRYWLCVRQVMAGGREVEITREDREDFEKLSAAMGAEYRQWLQDELLKADLDRGGLGDELERRPDCCRDDRFTAALFDRLATPEAAAALLGRKAFAEHASNPYFWLCRCWCQAAIRLGCCLACARTRRDYLRCIREYQGTLRGCLGPLRCELRGPFGCYEEQPLKPILDIGVAVTGTVAGAWFGGYTIEYRKVQGEECGNNSHWTSVGVVYPGGGPTGGAPVVNGTLGWIKTRLLTARSYEVRVCPRSTRGEAVRCCCIVFNLFKKFVMIEAVGAAVVGPDGVYDWDAPLIYPVPPSPTPHLVPIGCCVHVRGAAWVGECDGRRIKCFSLRYAPGCLPGPLDTKFNPAVYTTLLKPPVCYTPPDEDEKRDQPNQLTSHLSVLTTSLVEKSQDYSALFDLPPGTVVHEYWTLQPSCFDSTTLPACLDDDHHCASGQYTLLLDVEDELGNHYYDTQCVWFDNKPLHVSLGGIKGLKSCEEMSLQRYVGDRPCGTPWPAPVMGTAFDEWIIHTISTYPSNNFDYYSLSLTKNCGGPVYSVPITPDLVRWYRDIVTGTENPFKGTERVGEPGTRCPCDPQPNQPAEHGVLTVLDLRIFDADCVGQLKAPFTPPGGFALRRGECCTYVLQLYAQDKTVDEVGPGNCHHRWSAPCAFNVCNDLPRRIPLDPRDEVGEIGPVDAGTLRLSDAAG